MPSTYSPNLRIELIANGEQANTWGITTNTNLGTLLEQAITGYGAISVTAGDVVLTALDGASDQSRNMILDIVGTPGTARSVYCPASVTKIYVVTNDSNAAVTVYCGTALSHGLGITVPAGETNSVFCDGTDVFDAVTAVENFSVNNLTANTSITSLGSVSATAVLPNVAVNQALASNGLGAITASTTTATELGYVHGVTSAIQTQIDSKQPTITGAATSIVSSNLTTSRALASDGSGKVAVSATTATELGYVSGVTSAIQTQIDSKQPTVTVNGIVKGNGSGTLSAATAGTDYAPATSGTAILKGNGSGGFSSAVSGTDYVPPAGTGATGTWGINVSGNAATATIATQGPVNLGFAAYNYDAAGYGYRVVAGASNNNGIIQWTNSAQNVQWTSLVGTNGTLQCTTNFQATAFYGSGAGLNGTASSLSIGGNAATATLSTDCTNALGYSQTWQSVYRLFNTNYTNTTGKPIALSIFLQFSSASGQYVSLYSGGYNVLSVGGFTNVNYTIFFIVPVGGSYNLSGSSPYPSVYSWYELR